jgi:hypothetical protein
VGDPGDRLRFLLATDRPPVPAASIERGSLVTPVPVTEPIPMDSLPLTSKRTT